MLSQVVTLSWSAHLHTYPRPSVTHGGCDSAFMTEMWNHPHVDTWNFTAFVSVNRVNCILPFGVCATCLSKVLDTSASKVGKCMGIHWRVWILRPWITLLRCISAFSEEEAFSICRIYWMFSAVSDHEIKLSLADSATKLLLPPKSPEDGMDVSQVLQVLLNDRITTKQSYLNQDTQCWLRENALIEIAKEGTLHANTLEVWWMKTRKQRTVWSNLKPVLRRNSPKFL